MRHDFLNDGARPYAVLSWRGSISVRASRAGDDFHVLWAARRALRLIDPSDPLSLLRIEGLSPEDADDNDDRFLGCDVSEYEGGDSLTSARAVRAVQLKYSTEHPRRQVTASTLSSKPKAGQPVIRRLANMYAGLVQDRGVDAVKEKLTVSLVSNQPASKMLLLALAQARASLESDPVIRTIAELDQCEAASFQELQKLFAAVGGTQSSFIDFLHVLDLSQCGSDSRQLQQQELHASIGDLVLGAIRPGLLSLTDLVRREVMPERAESPGLRAEDVLAALGARSRASLFPYPSSLRPVLQAVLTRQAADLAAELKEPAGALLAHGGLGIGKTTTLMRLEEQLPPGSIVVVFDCFADGNFHQPNQARHSYRSCLQIANEIALRVGLAPVVASEGNPNQGDLFTALEKVLASASATMPDGALLVVAVDAADNAAVFARQQSEACFVDGLWGLRLPPNARLVMTCRSARRPDVVVRANPMPREFVLTPFDPEASSLLLRRRFQTATEEDTVRFHAVSQGVARVQVYALERAASATDAVEHASMGLKAIFDEIIDTALSTQVKASARRRQLAVLSVANRPASVEAMSAALGLQSRDLVAFIRGLEPGVLMVDGRTRFSDEDFDAHLPERVTAADKTEAHRLLADYFWPRRSTDEEAALHVGVHLAGAGRHHDLLVMARDEGPPDAIADGFLRARTQASRIRLAMDAARSATVPENDECLKLLIAAADAARTDTSLRDTVEAAPELAAAFADPGAVATMTVEQQKVPWLGKLHFRAAFLLARYDGQRDRAVDQLQLGLAWLRAWSPESEGGQSAFTSEDIARGALAARRLGEERWASQLLLGWRPHRYVESVAQDAVRYAPELLSWPEAAELSAGLRASTMVNAQLAVAFAESGTAIPAAHWREIAARLARLPSRATGDWLLPFCRYALEAGVGRRAIAPILRSRDVDVPYLDRYRAADQLAPYVLRHVMLARLLGRTTSAEEMRPPRLAKPADEEARSQRDIYDEFARHLLPLAEVSTTLAMRRKYDDDLLAGALDAAESVIVRVRPDRERRFHEDKPGTYALIRMAIDATVEALPGDASEVTKLPAPLASRVATFFDGLAQVDVNAAPTRLIHAASAMSRRHAAPELARQLLRRAADLAEENAMPAAERRDLLLEASGAAVADGSDAGFALSADLFGRAVAAASGLDADLPARLTSLLILAKPGTAEAADPELAALFVQAVESSWAKVSEPSDLPHRLAVEVTTRLGGDIGLDGAFRWADEDRLAFDDAIDACLPAAVETRLCTFDEAMTLTGLRVPERMSVSGLRRLAQAAPAGEARLSCLRRRFPQWVRAATVDAASPAQAQQLSNWLADEGLSNPRVESDLSDFVAKRPLPLPRGNDSGSSRDWFGRRPEVDLEQLCERASQSTARADLERMRSAFLGSDAAVQYLLAVAKAEEGGRVAALDFLAGLADTPHAAEPATVARALRAVLPGWLRAPNVSAWASRQLPDWVARHLTRLFTWDHEGPLHNQMMLVLPAEAAPVIDRVWVEIPRQLDQLDADRLLAAAVALGRGAGMSSASRQAARWALERARDTSSVARRDETGQTIGSFGRAFLAALGHEDVRRRWLAARALRDHLVTTRDSSLLRELLTAATDGSGGVAAMELPGALPRPLTALQWLLTAVSQTAAQAPQVLESSVDLVRSVALSAELPHAAIRELARRALEALDLQSDVVLANRPKRSSISREGRYDRGRSRGESIFPFNGMDTVPYWFSPLARLFVGTSESDVAERADRWVTDVWGLSWDAVCRPDPRARRRAGKYRLVSNDHGSLPVVETAQTYLEYHAMMLAAGELADQAELVRADADEDPWQHWLEGYLPARPWRSDARQAVPSDALSQGDDTLATFNEVDTGRSRHTDRLALAETCARLARTLDVPGDDVVVHAYVSSTIAEASCTAWTHTALVNPAALPALAAALSRVRDQELDLPQAEDEGRRWGNEIELPGLELRGWLRPIRHQESDVERQDPVGFAHYDSETVVPGREFTAKSSVRGHRPWSARSWADLDFWRDESERGRRGTQWLANRSRPNGPP